MQSVLDCVTILFTTAIQNALSIAETADVVRSPHFGDYTCSSTIRLFNKYKKSGSFGCKNIKELAERIIKALPENVVIEKAEATPMKGNVS